MSSMIIRSACLADAPAVIMIQRAAIAAIADASYSAEQRAAWRHGTEDAFRTLIAGGRYRVAEREGVLVGGAGWEETDDGASATVRAVFVHPALHGRGVGAALLRAIEADIAARGIARLEVPAALNAVGFYERLCYRAGTLCEVTLGDVRLHYRQMLKDAA